jgi:hypothetical protein
MRKFLLIAVAGFAVLSFSQLAAAQGSRSSGDAGASTEPRNPADASITKELANDRGDKQAEQQGALPEPEPRDRALREPTNPAANPGAGASAPAPANTDKQAEEAKPAQNKPQ